MMVRNVLGDPVELTFSAVSMSIGTQRKTAKAFRIASLKLNARKFRAFKTFALRRFQKMTVTKKKDFVTMKLNPKRRGNCEGAAVDINDMVEFVEEDLEELVYNIAKTRRAKTFNVDNCENVNFHQSVTKRSRSPPV